MRRIFASFVLVTALLFAPHLSTPSLAQFTTQSQTPTAEETELNSALSGLDQTQKDALIKLIQTLGTPGDKVKTVDDGPGFIATVKSISSGFGNYVNERFAVFPDFIGQFRDGLSAAFLEREGAGSFYMGGFLLLALAVGIAAEFLFNKIVSGWREQVQKAQPEVLKDILKTLFLRGGLEFGGLIVFGVVAVIVARLSLGKTDDFFLAANFILFAVFVARAAAALLRFALAPHRQDLRLVSVTDEVAQYLYSHFTWVFAFVGIMLYLATAMVHFGHNIVDDLRFWAGFAFAVAILWIIWRARSGLTSIIIGDEKHLTPGLERMAVWWPYATMVILIANWFLIQIVLSTGAVAISPINGTIAVAIVIIAPFLDTMVRGISRNLVPGASIGQAAQSGEAGEEELEAVDDSIEHAREETRRSYVRIGRTFLFGMIFLIIARLWGISLRDLAEAQLGYRFAANGVGAILILIIGYIIWEFTNLWISKQLAKEAPSGGHGGGEGGGTGASRLTTILPLVQLVLQFTIVTMTLLLTLSQLGVNIAPLLAGAGVLGLAVGFGAQTLVKDVVSGVFFLLDDAFRVGEFIDAGGTMGTVEKISVRSLQLRSINGPIHIVPYGEIAKVTNNSRDWVIMKLKFTVPFDTDPEKVRKIFKKIGQRLLEKEEIASDIIEPFKSQGVFEFNDVGIVVRGKFTSKPGRQFVIRKEIFNQVQKAFDENGIEFARKEVRVKIPGLDGENHLTEDQKTAIAGAASQAAENEVAPDPAAPPKDDR